MWFQGLEIPGNAFESPCQLLFILFGDILGDVILSSGQPTSTDSVCEYGRYWLMLNLGITALDTFTAPCFTLLLHISCRIT